MRTLPPTPEALLRVARDLLGTHGLSQRDFVDHVIHAAGGRLRTDPARPFAAQAWRAARMIQRRGVQAGDLVFFKDTHDLNGNGRPDDGITWVAVVDRVEPDRLLFLAQRAGRVRRMALSLSRRTTTRDGDGRVLNTKVVQWPSEPRPRTSGECFYGFARL